MDAVYAYARSIDRSTMSAVRSLSVPDRSWEPPPGTAECLWVLVDYRETGLWEGLGRLLGARPGPEIRLEQAALLVGDVEVTVRSATSGLLRRWIWERKTLADLSASIADGRWSEQRRRMCSAFPVGHVHYLLEGAASALLFEQDDGGGRVGTGPTHGVSAAAMRAALFRAQTDEGVHVHHTAAGQTAADFLAAWLGPLADAAPPRLEEWARGDRVHAGTLRPAAEVVRAYGDAAARAATLGARKNSNLTPELCYVQQLVQIPGLSAKLARTVQARYPDLPSLVRALEAEPEPRKRRKLFEDLEGIAKKRADAIVRYLGYP